MDRSRPPSSNYIALDILKTRYILCVLSYEKFRIPDLRTDLARARDRSDSRYALEGYRDPRR